MAGLGFIDRIAAFIDNHADLDLILQESTKFVATTPRFVY